MQELAGSHPNAGLTHLEDGSNPLFNYCVCVDTRKVVKTTKESYFDEQTVCASLVCCSKYTTVTWFIKTFCQNVNITIWFQGITKYITSTK